MSMNLSSNDFGEAQKFLELLDPETALFHFRTFCDRRPKPQPDSLARNLSGTLGELGATLKGFNDSGAGVYVVPNEGGQSAKEIQRVRAVFADFDGVELSVLNRCKLVPQVVVQTSPGKFHVYWLVDSLPLNQFTTVQKAIAASFGSDPKVSDVSHVMRLPGFLHQKGSPFLSHIFWSSSKPRFSADQIVAEFLTSLAPPPPPPLPSNTATVNIAQPVVEVSDKTIADLRSALTALRSDDRKLWIDVGCALRELGERGRGLWLDWSRTSDKFCPEDARSWDTLGHDHIGYKRIFSLAQQAGWVNPMSNIAQTAGAPTLGATTTRSLVNFRSAREMLQQPAPIPWLVKGILARNTLAALVGRPACGKTFLALDWACCVATSSAWAGHSVTKGAVFVIAGEGQTGIRRRLAAWEKTFGVSLCDCPLYVSDGSVLLDEGLNALVVQRECERLASQHGVQPALIVVDTLARNYAGDENSASDMGKFIDSLDRHLRLPWGACVLVLHHVGHGSDTQGRGRGSSALSGALDTCFIMEANDHLRTFKLTCTKAKDWEQPTSMSMSLQKVELDLLDEDGQRMTSCCVNSSSEAIAVNLKGASGRALDALQLLRTMHAALREQNIRAGLSAELARVSVGEFKKSLVERQILKDNSGSWRDLRKTMLDRNMIREDGEFIFCYRD